eukprot:2942071-Pyramimonas_sp.AAC.1
MHCGCGKTPWDQSWCKHCRGHWRDRPPPPGDNGGNNSGQGNPPKTNRAGKGRDQSAPDSPPGLAQGAPLPVGLVASAGADPAPDMSVEEVRQGLQLARKSHAPGMVAYYEQLLVLKESRPTPQQRAD